MRLRQVRKNYSKWKKKADTLKEWVLKNFAKEQQYKKFIDLITEDMEFISESDVDDMFSKLLSQEG